MIVFHGTTRRRAENIAVTGFFPKRPSRRVWFASGRGYATRRAKTQARRARDRPVVLTCEIDLADLRRRYGSKKVTHRSGIVAIDAHLPTSVLRTCVAPMDEPASPSELAFWVNSILRMKPHRGVSQRHPGILRLSTWVVNRKRTRPHSRVKESELLDRARQWLPDYFENVVVDPASLHAYRKANLEQATDYYSGPEEPDERSVKVDRALDCLISEKPQRRSKGLKMLAELQDPDLFDWLVLFLDDESVEVRVASLRAMRRWEEIDTEVVEPLAKSSDPRIRGAAIAALARHGGDDSERWAVAGMKDPEPCVRVEVATQLSRFDPDEHRAVFELALYDRNRDIAKRARSLTEGKGYHEMTSALKRPPALGARVSSRA